jgi:hypothetical protein
MENAEEPEVVLRTRRTVVRPWRAEEADRRFDIRRRIEVVRWLDGTQMQDRREATAVIDGYAPSSSRIRDMARGRSSTPAPACRPER